MFDIKIYHHRVGLCQHFPLRFFLVMGALIIALAGGKALSFSPISVYLSFECAVPEILSHFHAQHKKVVNKKCFFRPSVRTLPQFYFLNYSFLILFCPSIIVSSCLKKVSGDVGSPVHPSPRGQNGIRKRGKYPGPNLLDPMRRREEIQLHAWAGGTTITIFKGALLKWYLFSAWSVKHCFFFVPSAKKDNQHLAWLDPFSTLGLAVGCPSSSPHVDIYSLYVLGTVDPYLTDFLLFHAATHWTKSTDGRTDGR